MLSPDVEKRVNEWLAGTLGIDVKAPSETAPPPPEEDAELIVLPRDGLFSLWETNTELFATLVLNIAREACRRLGRADENLLHYFGAKSHRTP